MMTGWSKKAREEKQAINEEDAAEVIAVPQKPARLMKFEEDGEEGTSLWLLTFTDIMALMLTFFVLLYSMSVPKEEDWEDVTQGLHNEFSKQLSSQWYEGGKDAINIQKIDYNSALNLGYLTSVISGIIGKDERLENIVLIPQSKHLVISIPQELLFESGSADVLDSGRQALFALGGALSRIRNRIEVIGHTDPRPITNAASGFSSNWDLSLARAGSVAAILESVGYERGMTVRGLSSARYDELQEGMSEEERLSLSRRVDILVMQDDGRERNYLGIGAIP